MDDHLPDMIEVLGSIPSVTHTEKEVIILPINFYLMVQLVENFRYSNFIDTLNNYK